MAMRDTEIIDDLIENPDHTVHLDFGRPGQSISRRPVDFIWNDMLRVFGMSGKSIKNVKPKDRTRVFVMGHCMQKYIDGLYDCIDKGIMCDPDGKLVDAEARFSELFARKLFAPAFLNGIAKPLEKYFPPELYHTLMPSLSFLEAAPDASESQKVNEKLDEEWTLHDLAGNDEPELSKDEIAAHIMSDRIVHCSHDAIVNVYDANGLAAVALHEPDFDAMETSGIDIEKFAEDSRYRMENYIFDTSSAEFSEDDGSYGRFDVMEYEIARFHYILRDAMKTGRCLVVMFTLDDDDDGGESVILSSFCYRNGYLFSIPGRNIMDALHLQLAGEVDFDERMMALVDVLPIYSEESFTILQDILSTVTAYADIYELETLTAIAVQTMDVAVPDETEMKLGQVTQLAQSGEYLDSSNPLIAIYDDVCEKAGLFAESQALTAVDALLPIALYDMIVSSSEAPASIADKMGRTLSRFAEHVQEKSGKYISELAYENGVGEDIDALLSAVSHAQADTMIGDTAMFRELMSEETQADITAISEAIDKKALGYDIFLSAFLPDMSGLEAMNKADENGRHGEDNRKSMEEFLTHIAAQTDASVMVHLYALDRTKKDYIGGLLFRDGTFKQLDERQVMEAYFTMPAPGVELPDQRGEIPTRESVQWLDFEIRTMP